MDWTQVSKLHVEISSLCNAACPQCARHPTASYFLNPMIEDKEKWTLDQVKKNFPLEDLANLKTILYNGTVGDFITNTQAIPIAKYFSEANDFIYSVVNTNGSARPIEWWQCLAEIPRLRVNFAIDGLKDTNHIYRRRTDFDTIIRNAKAFIEAGGHAEWHMIVFDHNKHQIESCRELSKTLGFKKFHFRHTDRRDTAVRNQNGKYEYEIRAVTEDGKLKNSNFVASKQMPILLINESRMLNKTFKPRSPDGKVEKLKNLTDCESIREKSIYITSNWTVMPCCFLGATVINKEHDCRYNELIELLSSKNILISDFIADENNTVKQIIENRGFEWIYDKLETDSLLRACYDACHLTTSNYKKMWQKNKTTEFEVVKVIDT